jgi:hypothetical protein
MSGTVLDAVGTFALSFILAYVLLRLRCRKIGLPFGPRARYWSFFIVFSTAAVSTLVGLLIVMASHHGHNTFVGAIVPCGLWFRQFPPQRDLDLRPQTASNLLTVPFSRLYARMGDDMENWCEIRIMAAAPQPRYISDAVTYYHNQVSSRLKDRQVLAELDGRRTAITHKIKIVRLVSKETTLARMRTELQMHPSTEHMRDFTGDDLEELARRLESDALNELRTYLSRAYQLGYHNMLIYPFRPSAHRANVQAA